MSNFTPYGLQILVGGDVAGTAIPAASNQTMNALDAAAGHVFQVNAVSTTEQSWVTGNATLTAGVFRYAAPGGATSMKMTVSPTSVYFYQAPITGTAGTAITWAPIFSVVPASLTANYVEIDTAAPGNTPTLNVTGTDTNISMTLNAKGTAIVQFGNSSIPWAQITGPATSVSPTYVQLTGEDNSSPGMDAHGTAANISLELHAKGAASVDLGNYTGPVTWFSANGPATGGPLNYLLASAVVTGTSPQLTVSGQDTNINVLLVPKGSGVTVVSSTCQLAGLLNPTGTRTTPTFPGAGASPYTYTNNDGSVEMVTIVNQGGTTTQIVFTRNSVGITFSGSAITGWMPFLVCPGDQLTVNYTGAAPGVFKVLL